MYSRRTRAFTTSSSDTPAPNQFAPPKFKVQPLPEQVLPQSSTPDLQTQQEEVNKYESSVPDASMLIRHLEPKKPIYPGQNLKIDANYPANVLGEIVQREVDKHQLQEMPDLPEQTATRPSWYPKFTAYPKEYHTPPAPRLQMKLTIGQPGDMYEQEANRVAADVAQNINAPENPSVQREKMQDEEELQLKSEGSLIQRQEMIEDEEELQMKPLVQCISEEAMDATPDLEASIQQAKVSGQPLHKSVQEPMEREFGADFSGVRVHTDAQSHELNKSIQAKAFTTGSDIFFRQGAYEPSSRDGQKLLAHELTHVVQQNQGMVQRSSQPQAKGKALQPDNSLAQAEVLQRMYQPRHRDNTHGLAQQITQISGGRIQREGLTIQVLSGNDTPMKVTEVKIVGRPPKLFTSEEGDHTTAWAVISHVVKRELMGLTLSEAWDVVKALYSEAQNLPGANRVNYLAEDSNKKAISNLENATKKADAYNSMDKFAMSESDIARNLQGFINAYLLYRNALPFSAVSGKGTGNRESDYMEWMRVANDDETLDQAKKWVPNPLNKMRIREAAWGLLDIGKVETILLQTRRYETPGIKTFNKELMTELLPSEDSQGYDDMDLVITEEEYHARLLDVLTQHLLTIKAAFPKAYKDGDLDADDSFQYLFKEKKRTYKDKQPEIDNLAEHGIELPINIAKDYRSKKEEFEKKERAKRDQIPNEFKKRELFTQKSEVGVQITLEDDNTHIEEITLVGRPPKTYGKAEGDHVTAFAVLEQLIKYNLEGRPLLFAWKWIKQRIAFDKVELPGYDRIKNLKNTVGSQAKTNFDNADKAINNLIATDPDAGTVFPKLQQLIQAYLHFRNAFPLSIVFNENRSVNHGERVAHVKNFENDLNVDKKQALVNYNIDDIRKYMWGFFDAAAVKRMINETDSGKAAGIGEDTKSDPASSRLRDAIQQHLVTVETAFPTAFRVVTFDSQKSIENFLKEEPLSLNSSDAETVYKNLASFEVKRNSVYPQKAELLVEDKIDEIRVTAAKYGIKYSVASVQNYVLKQLAWCGYTSVNSTSIPNHTKYQDFLDKMDKIRPNIYASIIANNILTLKLNEIIEFAKTQGLIINADDILALLKDNGVNLTHPSTVKDSDDLANYYSDISRVTIVVYKPVITNEKLSRDKKKRPDSSTTDLKTDSKKKKN